MTQFPVIFSEFFTPLVIATLINDYVHNIELTGHSPVPGYAPSQQIAAEIVINQLINDALSPTKKPHDVLDLVVPPELAIATSVESSAVSMTSHPSYEYIRVLVVLYPLIKNKLMFVHNGHITDMCNLSPGDVVVMDSRVPFCDAPVRISAESDEPVLIFPVTVHYRGSVTVNLAQMYLSGETCNAVFEPDVTNNSVRLARMRPDTDIVASMSGFADLLNARTQYNAALPNMFTKHTGCVLPIYEPEVLRMRIRRVTPLLRIFPAEEQAVLTRIYPMYHPLIVRYLLSVFHGNVENVVTWFTLHQNNMMLYVQSIGIKMTNLILNGVGDYEYILHESMSSIAETCEDDTNIM